MAMAKQQQFHAEQRLQMQLTEAQKAGKKKPGHAGAFVGSFMSAPSGSGSAGYGGGHGGGHGGGSGDLHSHSKMPGSPLQNAGALVVHNGGRPPPPQPSERKLL